MQGFSTKKEFLEYLGKNPDDRKLVDRLIHRGEACMIDGLYYLVDKDARIAELEKEVEKLRNEIATFKESNWDLDELKVNCEFYENEMRRYAQYCADIVDVCYNKIKSVMGSRFTEDKETFKEWIQSMVKWEE